MENPIDHQDLSNLAYQKMKAMILENRLKPGQKLVQEQLAKILGVSRMPLHKAFQRLENELLVEHRPRRGFIVKDFSIQEAIDAFECREALEGIAARRLAGAIAMDDVVYLRSLFRPFSIDPASCNPLEYEEADNEFHASLIRLCGNAILQKLDLLGNVISRTYQQGLIRSPEETFEEHMAIIDAIEDRDGDLAEQLLREHHRKSRDAFAAEHGIYGL